MDLKNDRVAVRTNIVGLHAIAATLTKQPILNLKDEEADNLTKAVCDVADYHNINLLGTGGPAMLYASLVTTAYMVYAPRFIYIKHMQAAEQAKPANPGEYREESMKRAGTMDFSNDTTMH